MVTNDKPTKTAKFLKDFEYLSPSIMLGLIIISVGLYSILWIYLTNKKLEEHDKHAPESSRGLTVLMILPIIWLFTTYFFKTIIFTQTPLIIEILEIVIWGLIFFLILKYLIDFSYAITEITQSHPFLWISFFIIGIIGIIGIMLDIKVLYAFIAGIFIATIGIQSELNSLHKSLSIRKVSSNYYKR